MGDGLGWAEADGLGAGEMGAGEIGAGAIATWVSSEVSTRVFCDEELVASGSNNTTA